METKKQDNLRTWVEIDTAALRHNFSQLAKLIGPHCRFMAVVKSNAYGHGLTQVAKQLVNSKPDPRVPSLGSKETLNPKYAILTDIQGPEDHYGDMDLKVAGTRDGITAMQMDVKIEGVTMEILTRTLSQTKAGRLQILDLLEKIISGPRPELSPYAPRILMLQINPEKIGALIGPGGKTINEIIAQTGAQIDIEDDGRVFITADGKESLDKAVGLVRNITREVKPGELLEGKVTRLFEFGAMVEIGPRQEGLVHISELAPWRVNRVSDIVNVGDVIPVVVKETDEQGRINLSLKRVPDRYSEEEIARHAADNGSFGRYHDGGSGGKFGARPPRHQR